MHPEPVNPQVGPVSQHLSFTKLKGRGAAKQKKVSIYTPQLPNTSSIHETYTFVSQKQGFKAHGSHVTVKSSTSSIQFVEAMDSIMTDSHTNHNFSDFTGTDIETECLETEDDPKCKRTPLQSWKAECDTFLLELLRHDGRGDYMNLCVCGSCHFGLPEYRCIDCFSEELFCSKWTGSSFAALSLKQLGLWVQLGHPIGEECLLPQHAFNDNFTLIHTNGILKIRLDYCGCNTAQTHTTQLLRAAWFPATTSEPRMAATFQILEQYHLLSFESKASGYEFYHAIARLTDNTGLHPHKRRAISKEGTDPGLSQEWVYFIEETAYKSHLQRFSGKPQEKSTCSSHNAVNMADMKASQGLAAMGVGTIDCARHNMKLPNSVGDLQKGKRYTNMDYLFFSALSQQRVNVLNVLYDIACQWHKHLWQCMSTMPAHLLLDHASKVVRFFIPKFHLPAHILKYGEAPKRGWSNINPVVSSTKEMGPGSQRDTLDDHFGDWNWKKSVGLGATLLRKMNEANEEHEAHANAFEELNGALKPETTTGWRAGVKLWEENPNDVSVPNPFEVKVSTITQAAVRLKLVEIEACQLQEGNNMSLHIDVSPSVFIATGIDLESEHLRRRFKSDFSLQGAHQTDRQKTVLMWQQNALQRKAGDALDEIRQSLRLRDYMYTFKCNWICGQSTNTHTQNALGRVEARAAAAADRYRAAHTALSSLTPVLNKVGWSFKLRSLNNKDNVCGMTVPRKGESEGRRQLSWIWVVEGVGDDEDEVVQDGLRVEWCKACARMMRWKEEIELLREEMEGVVAYATRQAQIRHDLGAKFEVLWVQHITATGQVFLDSSLFHLPDLHTLEIQPVH
ncbi:hypothetical protein BDR03DRAFT_982484 [Suillus americanus]|nr:hypothetical protein BDR03DRAFT_982484 [Suillus americanus]